MEELKSNEYNDNGDNSDIGKKKTISDKLISFFK
jgi:hypothetical protein